jgi:hypothetical protein
MENEEEEALINNMNEKLLKFIWEGLNQNIINHNLKKIVDKLENLDEEKEKHKYLCLS